MDRDIKLTFINTGGRGLLLLEAGVEPDVLHDRPLGSSSYLSFLANLANLAEFVTELGWELPGPQSC